jgi:CRP-like cAMP-binding protein/thioredoxin reductase/NAD-dependent dihydropyrimidine dehydrogenase PreA subunit
MPNHKIAIVGSGPAGLSAAGRAAEHDIDYVLLEKADHFSDTIFKYQKGKHVMSTPDVLPLRSSFEFGAGQREDVLGRWDKRAEDLEVKVRHNAEVTAITGEQGNFEIALQGGETVSAENVVLSIGLQGNLRKLGVPGSEQSWVQYQLDDPDEYDGETIVVVGAGDAAIENAVALAGQNNVIIVNRRDEFARVKQGNLNLIVAAIENGDIECYYNSSAKEVRDDKNGKVLVLKTADGEADVKCDRVIARLGAIPPRKFVESCDIEFSSPDPGALPEVSATYESNVPGLYIIGALGGYPLIKQAMNQGYEVVEFILGNDVKPADEPLLEAKFKNLGIEVGAALELFSGNVPLLSGLTTLQLREFLIDSNIHTPKPGELIFKRNDFTNSFYSVVSGTVGIAIDPDDPSMIINLSQGQFFGEMGLISGRRRSATVTAIENCVLIETPRRSMIKLMNSVEAVKREMDQEAMRRQIKMYIAPHIGQEDLNTIVESTTLESFGAGEILFREGDDGDSVYLIRRGSVTVSRGIGGREVVLSYVPAGHYVGEMALLTNAKRSATLRAAVATEALRMEGSEFKSVLERNPELRSSVEAKFQDRLAQNVTMENAPEVGGIIEFLVSQGAGEATDILLIDESLCVRCDNCEVACAETHGGTSRLDREAGPTFANVHVPTSCRHCEHPHCMSECPSNSIHRAPNGEVFMDESCIGCGNCERNCPYGVIHMSSKPPAKPPLWQWLLLGAGPGPGEHEWPGKNDAGQKKTAVKCDMCKDIAGGPACVRACPTGAALRVNPEEFFSLTLRQD